MQVGGQCYALLLEKKGRVVSDLFLTRLSSGFDVSVSAPVFDAVFQVFDRHIIMEDVELSELQAGVLLEEFRETEGAVPRGRAHASFRWVTLLPKDAIDVGSAAGRGLRALLGVPVFGVEFDGGDYPQEAGIGAPAVSMSKGCYLGQEVVCMIQMRGHVSRQLCTVHVQPPALETELYAGADKAGQIRGVGDHAGARLAFAMLKRAHLAPGTALCSLEGVQVAVVCS